MDEIIPRDPGMLFMLELIEGLWMGLDDSFASLRKWISVSRDFSISFF